MTQELILENIDIFSRLSTIMPIDIFSLARYAVAYKDDNEFFGKLVTCLSKYNDQSNGHAYARRVVYTALIYAEKSEYTTFDLLQVLDQGLSDSNKWVQYDAATAIEKLKVSNDSVVTKLKFLAKDYDEIKDKYKLDSEASLRKQAYRTLQALAA